MFRNTPAPRCAQHILKALWLQPWLRRWPAATSETPCWRPRRRPRRPSSPNPLKAAARAPRTYLGAPTDLEETKPVVDDFCSVGQRPSSMIFAALDSWWRPLEGYSNARTNEQEFRSAASYRTPPATRPRTRRDSTCVVTKRRDAFLLRAARSGRAPEHLSEFRVRTDEWLVTAQDSTPRSRCFRPRGAAPCSARRPRPPFYL